MSFCLCSRSTFVNEADAIRQIALVSLISYFHMGCDFWLYDGILSYSIRCCHPSHRLSTVRAILIAIVCTFFPFLDIPVFWPILVLYFIMLFTLMMKRQIKVSRFASSEKFHILFTLFLCPLI
ncbi:Protein RER1 [Fasciola gigantica]|uniref:Protein RER1 n=1 Tax=Fasciola gigantica TaxID=46835 RepID=A0A504YJU0_FASGI|nr:Protein RER1 [Fasciola gigantica]